MKRLLTAAVILLPLLFSCPSDNPFSDLEGINLLSTEERAFEGWAVDYGTDTTFDYMTFGMSSESGPTADSSVYRMEILNLVPNGDFNVTPLSAAWTDAGGATSSITSGRLVYDLTDATERVNYDLSDAGDGISDTLVAGASYIIRFRLKADNGGTSYFEYTRPLNTWQLSIINEDPVYNFPEDFANTADSTFVTDATTNIFTIGSTAAGGKMSGYIDDLRVARVDITSCVVIDVPVSSPWRTNLSSGTYRFTVYVKNDPDVTPVTDNRMAAEGLCLALGSSDDASVSSFSAVSYDASSAWDGWTACSVSGFVQIDSASETALRLRISPTDTLQGAYGRDVGSLLISSPVLEFSADGTF